jgi:hypothetical protein
MHRVLHEKIRASSRAAPPYLEVSAVITCALPHVSARGRWDKPAHPSQGPGELKLEAPAEIRKARAHPNPDRGRHCRELAAATVAAAGGTTDIVSSGTTPVRINSAPHAVQRIGRSDQHPPVLSQNA